MDLEVIYKALFEEDVEEYIPDSCAHSEVFLTKKGDQYLFCFVLYDLTDMYKNSNIAYGIIGFDCEGNFSFFKEIEKKIELPKCEKEIKEEYKKTVRYMYESAKKNDLNTLEKIKSNYALLTSKVFGKTLEDVLFSLG